MFTRRISPRGTNSSIKPFGLHFMIAFFFSFMYNNQAMYLNFLSGFEERGDRRLRRMKRPERVAGIDGRRCCAVSKENIEDPNRKSACLQPPYSFNSIYNRMWLSLVERLLWEQDAAGSNPVIRTTQRELPLVGSSLCAFVYIVQCAAACEQSKVLALGQNALRCRWQIQQSVLCAAVDKIKEKREPADFIGHRKPAAKPKMPQVRILSSGPRQGNGIVSVPLAYFLYLFLYLFLLFMEISKLYFVSMIVTSSVG